MYIIVWAQEAVFIHICIIVIILDCLGQVSCRCFIWVELPVQRRRCPNFLKYRRVTRHPLVFRGLMSSQQTLGIGVSQVVPWVELPVTKETLPDFREWCRVTRHSRVFCGLTGCQRTPRFGASQKSLRFPPKNQS